MARPGHPIKGVKATPEQKMVAAINAAWSSWRQDPTNYQVHFCRIVSNALKKGLAAPKINPNIIRDYNSVCAQSKAFFELGASPAERDLEAALDRFF